MDTVQYITVRAAAPFTTPPLLSPLPPSTKHQSWVTHHIAIAITIAVSVSVTFNFVVVTYHVRCTSLLSVLLVYFCSLSFIAL